MTPQHPSGARCGPFVRALALSGAFLAWLCAAAPVPAAQADHHALLIGISRYDAKSGATPLPGVPHDLKSAAQIAQALGIPSGNVRVLSDGAATKPAIVGELQALAQRVAEGGRALIYFSGHGTRWFDPQAGGCVEGLYTYEGATLVNRELADLAKPLGDKADKLIVMFDACHSEGVTAPARTRSLPGALTPKFFVRASDSQEACARPSNLRTRSLFGEVRRLGSVSENIIHISSSRPDEVSFDDPARGGLATQAVRDCMFGAARDLDQSGGITLAEIEHCARAKVRERLQGHSDLLPHHPTITGQRNLLAFNQQRREEERLAQQREQAARLAQAERAEALRLEQARLAREAEDERRRAEAAEQARQRERAELARREQARLAAERRDLEHQAQQRAEAERQAREGAERARLAAERRRLEDEARHLAVIARDHAERLRIEAELATERARAEASPPAAAAPPSTAAALPPFAAAPPPPAAAPATVASPALGPAATLQDILAQQDPRRRLTVSLKQARLRIDQDELALAITSARDGYLYVIHIEPDLQHFTLLFPNRLQSDNHIRAGQTLRIPRLDWRLTSAGPPGLSRVLSVVTDSPRDLRKVPTAGTEGPFTQLSTDPSERHRLIDFVVGTSAGGNSGPFAAVIVNVEEYR